MYSTLHNGAATLVETSKCYSYADNRNFISNTDDFSNYTEGLSPLMNGEQILLQKALRFNPPRKRKVEKMLHYSVVC